MPEQQSVAGDKWTKQATALLSNLGWKQLGDTNVDVKCDKCGGKSAHGLDAVFYYENPASEEGPEGFFVEAKRYAWENAPAGKLQEWYDSILTKLEHLPLSSDFNKKFSPPKGARFNSGILAIWHHDNYDENGFRLRLEEVVPARRKETSRIFVMSNREITWLAAVIEAMGKLESDETISGLQFFFPYRGTARASRKSPVPVGFIYSRYMFAKYQRETVGKNASLKDDEVAVFYSGSLERQALEFLRETCNELQLTDGRVVVLAGGNIDDNRPQIEGFTRENEIFEFQQLVVGNALPDWIANVT